MYPHLVAVDDGHDVGPLAQVDHDAAPGVVRVEGEGRLVRHVHRRHPELFEQHRRHRRPRVRRHRPEEGKECAESVSVLTDGLNKFPPRNALRE